MLTVEVDDKYAKAIDSVIAKSRMYSSRSEFLKDAIRKNLAETAELDEGLRKIREGAIELGRLARSRGWDGSLLTREEKEAVFRKYIKEKGIKLVR